MLLVVVSQFATGGALALDDGLQWDLNLISQEMLSRAVKFTWPSSCVMDVELASERRRGPCMQIISELNCGNNVRKRKGIDRLTISPICWLTVHSVSHATSSLAEVLIVLKEEEEAEIIKKELFLSSHL